MTYARISDDREGRHYGVDRQTQDCDRLAERNGDEVVAKFIDDDRSAYSGKVRREYVRMLQFLRDGHADGVYALAPTRLYRRLDDGLEFFKLINQRGLHVETVKAGRYNLSTADGRRDALRAAIDAQHESELIGERVRDAKADNVRRGEWRGGPRPFGYEDDGVTARSLLCLTAGCSSTKGFDVDRHCLDCGADAVNKPGSEFWYIELCTDSVIASASLTAICRTLAEQGARTPERRYKKPDGTKGEPESKAWGRVSLRRMLLRPRNAGLLEVDGQVVGRAAWPAAVPEDKWRACADILENPARSTGAPAARVWLLTGLIHCHCRAPMKGSTTGIGGGRKKDPENPRKMHVPAYRCSVSPGHGARRAEKLDRYVESLVIDRLSREDAASLLRPAPTTGAPYEDLAAQANTLRAKLDSISADYAQDLLTRKQALDATAATRDRIEALEAKMAARAMESVLQSIPLGTEQIGKEWASYDLEKRRAIVAAVIEVTVHRARGGRPSGNAGIHVESIEIVWKTASSD